jgi:pimeloyl-ACP methyl ester carboxylesterase
VPATKQWRPSRTYEFTGGKVAYEIFGDGSPVVLIHGTPSWSYLWRNVASDLALQHTVYVYDLLGYGTSEQREHQDVSIAAQTRVLAELLDLWALEQPCVAGHDLGGAVALRLLLLEGRRFRRLALCDPVAIAPWITPFSRHVQAHVEVFQAMPGHIHQQMVATHIRSAIAREMSDDQLEPYLRPWLGAAGQAAYYRQVAQFDESYTRQIEPRYGEIQTPTLLLWGAQDGWLDPQSGHKLAEAIPGARLSLITGAGHFLPEDQPDAVAAQLSAFFGEDANCVCLEP